jgi:shikimate kinase
VTMWLVGMMGSGKTRGGRLAATRLGVGFADTDEEVSRSVGLPLAGVWASMGEAGFRDLEREAVAGLAGFAGVVATGGGVILDEGNRQIMSSGRVVWLRAPPRALAVRVSGTERPLLHGDRPDVETLTRLLAEREELYRAIAHHEVDTESLDVEEVAHRIESLWNG